MKDNATDVIRFRISPEDRIRIQRLADKKTHGNVSSLIKGLIQGALYADEVASQRRETRFELIRRTAEIKSRQAISDGCTADDVSPETVATFADEASALEALAGFKSSARLIHGQAGPYWYVTEYAVAENIYKIDDDGDADWIDSNGETRAKWEPN